MATDPAPQGPQLGVVVAQLAFVVVAVGVFLPPSAARAALVLALVLAAAIWLAEGLGGMLTGSGTDPNSGPLLALLAIAYWPVAKAVWRPAAIPAPAPTGEQ